MPTHLYKIVTQKSRRNHLVLLQIKFLNGTLKLVGQKFSDNARARKRKKDKQYTKYIRFLKTEQHVPQLKQEVSLVSPKG